MHGYLKYTLWINRDHVSHIAQTINLDLWKIIIVRVL